MPTAANPIKSVVDLCTKFIEAKKGSWDHDAWEGLLAQVAKTGIEITDEVKINLGNMLEAGKYFYKLAPAAAPKKAAAKPKAKPKAKSKG
ncbi:MAG: hypothetical protein K1Y02_01355 [Candidatus Hydrogenedentes bacterium]|nr:hypothetical protein [Candidatus Hydrogenedentota bacterium]